MSKKNKKQNIEDVVIEEVTTKECECHGDHDHECSCHEGKGEQYDEYVNALKELVIDKIAQLDADNWIKENGVYINTTDGYEYKIEIKDDIIYIFDNIKIKDINTTVVN